MVSFIDYITETTQDEVSALVLNSILEFCKIYGLTLDFPVVDIKHEDNIDDLSTIYKPYQLSGTQKEFDKKQKAYKEKLRYYNNKQL